MALCDLGSHPKSGSFSSSGQSESSVGGGGGASSGNETEEGELKARHLLVANHSSSSGQRVLVKIRPPQLPARQHREASCSSDGRQSSDEDDDDEEEEEEEEAEEGDSNSSGHDMDAIPDGIRNLKMRIVAPDQRRVVSRPCVPQGNLQARLARSEADLFTAGHVHLPMMSQYGSRARQRRKLVRLRQQLAADDSDRETADGQMPDLEDSVMQHMDMGAVKQAAEPSGMCAREPGDENDDDAENNDVDAEEEDEDSDDEEESSESSSSDSEWTSVSSPTSSSEPVDQSTPAKASRRRHGENLNSEEEGTPKHKRSKSDVDSGKVQSGEGATVTKNIASKEAVSAEPTAADQKQVSASASLQDNIPISQVSSIHFRFHNITTLDQLSHLL